MKTTTLQIPGVILLGLVLSAHLSGLGAREIHENEAFQDSTADSCAPGVEGTVTAAEGTVPLPGAEVHARWKGPDGSVGERTIETDDSGEYSLCSMEPSARLWLIASAYHREGRPAAITVPDEGIRRQDLHVPIQRGETGTIVGRILDRESQRPVEAATVMIPGLEASALTDGDGRFRVGSVPPGTHQVTFRHVAYGEHSTDVRVPPGRTVDVEIEAVQEAIEVEPITVTVEARDVYLDQQGFYERVHDAEVRGGYFVTPEMLERRNPLRVSHVLEAVPRVKVSRFGVPWLPRSLGISASCNRGMLVYLDGTKFPLRGTRDGIDRIPASDVAAMEVYRGPSELPAEFSGSDARCGVVAIWTKRGAGSR